MEIKHNKTDNVYRRLLNARCYIQEHGLTKEGVNTHQDFTFFRLEEIIPAVNEACQEFGLLIIMSSNEASGVSCATARVINIDQPEERIEFVAPFRIPEPTLSSKGNEVTSVVQRIGAAETYSRRYLFLKVFDIVESDKTDMESGKPATNQINRKPPTIEEKQEIKKGVVNKEGQAPKIMINNLKKKLNELKTLDPSANDFIKQMITNTEKFQNVTKEQAEDLILEVDEKIKSAKETVEND